MKQASRSQVELFITKIKAIIDVIYFNLVWQKKRMILLLKNLPWEESQQPASLFMLISCTLF